LSHKKKKSFKSHAQRDAQFQRITQLNAEYLEDGQPVISIDTKKKELLGNFYRDGKLYTREQLEVLDHDFPSYSEGSVIPHGLYDIGLNKAHVNIGVSRDTTQFACDSVAHWWEKHGRADYPQATRLLLLCDGGGSNPSNSWLFKSDLQNLADRLEHRVFPHITRACAGVVFSSVSLVRELIEKARTKSGLKVTADILDGVYEAGRTVTRHARASLNIEYDSALPSWNYSVRSRNAA
jgi:hypothetical protein